MYRRSGQGGEGERQKAFKRTFSAAKSSRSRKAGLASLDYTWNAANTVITKMKMIIRGRGRETETEERHKKNGLAVSIIKILLLSHQSSSSAIAKFYYYYHYYYSSSTLSSIATYGKQHIGLIIPSHLFLPALLCVFVRCSRLAGPSPARLSSAGRCDSTTIILYACREAGMRLPRQQAQFSSPLPPKAKVISCHEILAVAPTAAD